jgi:hypothetical protein
MLNALSLLDCFASAEKKGARELIPRKGVNMFVNDVETPQMAEQPAVFEQA